MAKLEIEVVKPNLQMRKAKFNIGEGTSILYSVYGDDVIKSARAVDDVVRKHIDETGLKVGKSDLEIVKFGEKRKPSEEHVLLEEYLDIIGKEGELGDRIIGNEFSKHFNVGHIIDAFNYTNYNDLAAWHCTKRDLTNPEKAFDELEEDKLVFRLDRKRTLENIKKLNEELDKKIPIAYVDLCVIDGIIETKFKMQRGYIGEVDILSLREEGNEKAESANKELIEKLKEFNGPCLSNDAYSIVGQHYRVYKDAQNLVNRYGDIILNPDWKERFFRLDP